MLVSTNFRMYLKALAEILPDFIDIWRLKEICKTLGMSVVGKKRQLSKDQIPYYREKFGNLSEFIKDLKQSFTRFYNKKHKRRGYFWGNRFKSLIIQKGETLINTIAYVDLNAVRAGIVEKPEDYRWCSIAYHAQTGNKDKFLSLDFGLKEFGVKDEKERFRLYRKFVYETGGVYKGKKHKIKEVIVEKERSQNYKLTRSDRFKYRTRYFTESGIIGSKEFIKENIERFSYLFPSKSGRTRVPRNVIGLDGIYSLKRLNE